MSAMSDQEIKEMRAIAKMNGRPLSDERIDVSAAVVEAQPHRRPIRVGLDLT